MNSNFVLGCKCSDAVGELMRFIGSFAWITDSSLIAMLSACKGFNILSYHFQCLFSSPILLLLIYNNPRNLILVYWHYQRA